MQSAVYVQLYSTNRDTALVYMREKKGLRRSEKMACYIKQKYLLI